MSQIKINFPPQRLNQKYQYPFSLQNQASFLLFLYLKFPTYLPPQLPACLPTRLLPLLLPHLLACLPTRLLPSTTASSSRLPTDQSAVLTVTLSATRLSKNFHLEHYLNKIITSFDYSAKVNNSVIDYLKDRLKDIKKEAVLQIKSVSVKCQMKKTF